MQTTDKAGEGLVSERRQHEQTIGQRAGTVARQPALTGQQDSGGTARKSPVAKNNLANGASVGLANICWTDCT